MDIQTWWTNFKDIWKQIGAVVLVLLFTVEVIGAVAWLSVGWWITLMILSKTGEFWLWWCLATVVSALGLTSFIAYMKD